TFGLAACGGNDDADSASEDNNSAQSQTIESVDAFGGTLSASYPGDWTGQAADGAIYLANSTEALQMANTMSGLTDGQVGGTITFLATGVAIPPQEAGTSMVDVLSLLSATLLSGEAGIIAELGAPEAFSVNGKEGAIATGPSEDNDVVLSLAVAVVGESDGYALIVFAAPEGEIDQYKEIIKAIAGSVEYIGGAIDLTPEAASVEGTPEPTPAG
ncbi:MAG: hypothetical protein H7Y09_07125, partial [Chitinophagaceae bacterium]|nr:hypothetical protein [Anaerolineae bacterium]